MNLDNPSLIKPPTGRLKTCEAGFAKTHFVGFAKTHEAGFAKTRQRGMTLVEVLISMFVLAVGVLALLATQLRTVASVQEAESQTIVAQAVQNLMESMLINPTLCSKEDENDKRCSGKSIPEGWVVKNYDNNNFVVGGGAVSYRFSSPIPIKVRKCGQSRWCKSDTATSLNKREILEDHLGRFEESLANALPNANTWYIICNDNSGRDMKISGNTVSHQCSGGNAPLVVKVLWEMEAEKVENKSITNNGKKVFYTYQARFAE